MAENDVPHGAPATPVDPAPEPQDPAQETDWVAESRKWEKRAKENLAAAKANEAAAKRLAEIEEAQKTEAQKQQDALEKAQRELADERAARARAEVAAAKGVPAELLSGSTREELEASADALIQFRGEQPLTDPDHQQFVIPNEGGSPATALNGDGLENALRQALGIQS